MIEQQENVLEQRPIGTAHRLLRDESAIVLYVRISVRTIVA